MNIDVIGGSGFIGTKLISILSQREDLKIKIIDKVSSKLFPNLTEIGDVRSIDNLQQHITTNAIIINLAAEHRDDVRPVTLYDEVNVNGAKNICSVARNKNIKTIIFTSSVAVYGFAPVGTDELGKIAPINDYGRTKFAAEKVFTDWQNEASQERTLVIIRPTVVFGEQNRGNVYNLLRQIAIKRFVMIGRGENRKSMAYVHNVAKFIEHTINFTAGVHIYNYIDKPDFTMNSLVTYINKLLNYPNKNKIRIPFAIGYIIGRVFDVISVLTGKRLSISSIRVKKFCADSVYSSSVEQTGFVAPVPLSQAIEQTIRYEFVESHENESVFYTE